MGQDLANHPIKLPVPPVFKYNIPDLVELPFSNSVLIPSLEIPLS